jgi:non-ribosomal peptide synthetase component F
MNAQVKGRTGEQLIVDQLAVHDVEHFFCVPGESYLAVLDALHDATINVTVCRQESGAAMMAEAAGKLTGRNAALRQLTRKNASQQGRYCKITILHQYSKYFALDALVRAAVF